MLGIAVTVMVGFGSGRRWGLEQVYMAAISNRSHVHPKRTICACLFWVGMHRGGPGSTYDF